MLRLHRIQLGVVLAHFLHKSFLQTQHFVQLNELLGELGLPQCMMGRKGLRRLLTSNASDVLLEAENVLIYIRAEEKDFIL